MSKHWQTKQRTAQFFRVSDGHKRRLETLDEQSAVNYARMINVHEKRGALDNPFVVIDEIARAA